MPTADPVPPTKLLRAMRKDERSQPVCGSRGNMLGVRPNVDIVTDAAGIVVGGVGGMSVTPDDVKRMPPHVRPPKAGGKGRLPIFELAVGALGTSLALRLDPLHPLTHGFVEPGASMSLDSYQSVLCATGPRWTEVT